MLNITSCEGNENSNHNDIPNHYAPLRMVKIQTNKWIKTLKLAMPDANKGAKKRTHSLQWECVGHFLNQSGGSL